MVDTSVTLALCFADEWTPEIDPILRDALDGRAVAPALWALETANALETAVRRGRVSPDDGAVFLKLFRGLSIRLVPTERTQALGAIAGLARRHALSAYDAAYLHCALMHALPLATRDKALADGARREGVALLC